MTPIAVADLTAANTAGNGVFDVLMRAVKAHLDEEFKRGAIKGADFATVYLGSLNLALQSGMNFLLQKERVTLEANLLEKQIELAQIQVEKAGIELAMLIASQAKIPAEIAQLEAQTALIGQQRINLASEGENIPKQGELLDKQVLLAIQQKNNLISENLGILAKTSLTQQQAVNAVTEELVLVAQKCLLQAQFDKTQSETLKSAGEIELLAQKTATEKAQVLAVGVDADSVIGKQKALYQAQTSGFARDAEQKAAKLLADTWSVRRTTDEATVADATNMLYDTAIGRAVTKLLDGVGA
jgi:hypothetical protein